MRPWQSSLLPAILASCLGLNKVIRLSQLGGLDAAAGLDVLPFISPIKDPKHDPGAAFLQVVKQTTHLLYEKSDQLDDWLNRPLPRIYVYDTLPPDWTNVTTISECVDRTFLGDREWGHWPNCRWYPRVCNDRTPPSKNGPNPFKESKFFNYRYNYNTDVALVEWFRHYPGRTRDPSEADLFVVPYPHWSQCLCHKNFQKISPQCSYNLQTIEENVISHLRYLNQSTSAQHVWILGADWGLIGNNFRKRLGVSLSLGPVPDCNHAEDKPCGRFVTPFANTGQEYQPTSLTNQPWWHSDRAYSLGSILGTPNHLEMRVKFATNHTLYLGSQVRGLATRLVNLGKERKQFALKDIMEIYTQSLFCPVLPGDGPPQKRFFDVILMGCIPLVPVWPAADGGVSFWRNGSASIRATYPFALGSFFRDDDAGVDYLSDLVLPFDGACGLACMKGAVEAVSPEKLKQLQANLLKYAPLFSFGLEGNMYQSVDAFSALLVSLRHYVHFLKPKKR